MKLGPKLITVFLALSLIPLTSIAIFAHNTATSGFDELSTQGKETMESDSYDQLEANLALKKDRIEDQFQKTANDVTSLRETADTTMEAAFECMEALGDQKLERISDYFTDTEKDAGSISETANYMVENAHTKAAIDIDQKSKQVEELFVWYESMTRNYARSNIIIDCLEYYETARTLDGEAANTAAGSAWSNVTANWSERLDLITSDYGLYDLFLISHDGEVLYSTARESDLGENVTTGSLAEEGLGKVFAAATAGHVGEADHRAVSMVDYDAYTPSGGAHAAFMAYGVHDYDGELHGVFAIQLPSDHIDEVVNRRTGMGATQETFLVGETASGVELRSNRVVKSGSIGDAYNAAFATAALNGERGFEIRTGSTGMLELVAYQPLNLSGLNWAILDTIALEEALSPLSEDGDLFELKAAAMGYSDIKLVHTSGEIIYSTAKKADYHTDLTTGPYRDTLLASAYETALASGMSTVSDMSYYEPASAQIFFIVAPIYYNGSIIVLTVIEIDNSEINRIMGDYAGLGSTGDSYLVSLNDNLPRSKLRGVSENTVLNPSYPIDTVATQQATSTLQSGIYQTYDDRYVVGVYKEVGLGHNWVMITEKGESEVLNPETGHGRSLALFGEAYGYYDVFLINADGYIEWSMAKESDYETNLLTGEYANTNLGSLFEEALAAKGVVFSDFAYYPPSEDQAAFAAIPVEKDDVVVLVMAVQVPTETINSIMNEHTGLGDTGETYLVGEDKLMRSNSRFSTNSSGDIGTTRVDTPSVSAALDGESGHHIINDYRGVRVLSAYAPLDHPDEQIDYAVLAEIDEAEAFADAAQMVASGDEKTQSLTILIIAIVVVAALVALLVAFLFTRSITSPVQSLAEGSKKLAEGDFSVEFEVDASDDEIGEMVRAYRGMLANTATPLRELSVAAEAIAAGDLSGDIDIDAKGEMNTIVEAFGKMQSNLKSLVREIQHTSSSVAATSQELASSAEEMNASTQQVSGAIQQISQGAQQQADQIEGTAKVMQMMTESVDEVADRSVTASEKAGENRESAREGRDAIKSTVTKMRSIRDVVVDSASVIENLGVRSEEIGQIVDVITGITDQTNLLALNAAIEAARAGEHGRGFAVVAEEVKNLAEDSKNAAERISTMIREIQGETSRAVESMQIGTKEVEEGIESVTRSDSAFEEIAAVAQLTAEEVKAISLAAQQQRAGSEQVAVAVDEIAGVAEEAASASEESASSTEELTASMEDMTARTQELSDMAGTLQRSASQFRIDRGGEDIRRARRTHREYATGAGAEDDEGGARRSRSLRSRSRSTPTMPKKVEAALKKRHLDIDNA